MAKHWINPQQDLFEESPLAAPLGPTERAQALEQLQALLIEAITTPTDQREAGDDEDHA